MSDSIRRVLFPAHMRQVPYRRVVLNIFRALHILCFSVLVGGVFFQQSAEILQQWLIGVMFSGLALFLLDLYGSFIILFEVRGVSVSIKLLMLLSMPMLEQASQFWLLMLIIIFSAFVAHSTRRIRHKNLLPVAWQQKYGLDREVAVK